MYPDLITINKQGQVIYKNTWTSKGKIVYIGVILDGKLKVEVDLPPIISVTMAECDTFTAWLLDENQQIWKCHKAFEKGKGMEMTILPQRIDFLPPMLSVLDTGSIVLFNDIDGSVMICWVQVHATHLSRNDFRAIDVNERVISTYASGTRWACIGEEGGIYTNSQFDEHGNAKGLTPECPHKIIGFYNKKTLYITFSGTIRIIDDLEDKLFVDTEYPLVDGYCDESSQYVLFIDGRGDLFKCDIESRKIVTIGTQKISKLSKYTNSRYRSEDKGTYLLIDEYSHVWVYNIHSNELQKLEGLENIEYAQNYVLPREYAQVKSARK